MRLCIVCGKSFTNPGRRCNACRNKVWKLANREKDLAQRRAYNKRRWQYVKPVHSEKHCQQCSKVFMPNNRTPNQPFCSSSCRLAAYREKRKEIKRRWIEANLEKYKLSKRLSDAKHKDKIRFSGNRLSILGRDNYTCQDCGSNGPKLNVHHIDESGSSDNPNNNIDNLITLCAACHKRRHNH